MEAKEGIDITALTGAGARVTIQTLFRRYEHLAGMSGTASQSRREFKKVYARKVTVVPTHRKCIRRGSQPRGFTQQAARALIHIRRCRRSNPCIARGWTDH